MTDAKFKLLVETLRPAARCTESEFQTALVELLRGCGWLVYHTYDSRRSAAGFPDLTIVRDGRIIFLELKAERGRLSTEQARWIVELSNAMTYWENSPVETYVVRPADWDRLADRAR